MSDPVVDTLNKCADERDQLRAENERLRDALEAIKRHQRIAGGSLSAASTTFLIADAALRNEAMKDE